MTDAWKTEPEEGDISPRTNKKYGDIEILEVVDAPPPSSGSIYTEVIESLIGSRDEEIADGFKWRGISTGGRQKNTVQSGLQNAASRYGVKVETKTADVDGDPRVYVRLVVEATDDDTDDASDEEQ